MLLRSISAALLTVSCAVDVSGTSSLTCGRVSGETYTARPGDCARVECGTPGCVIAVAGETACQARLECAVLLEGESATVYYSAIESGASELVTDRALYRGLCELSCP